MIGPAQAWHEARALYRLARHSGESFEAMKRTILPGPDTDRLMAQYRRSILRFFCAFVERGDVPQRPKSISPRKPALAAMARPRRRILTEAKRLEILAALQSGKRVLDICREVHVGPHSVKAARVAAGLPDGRATRQGRKGECAHA
jgi:hypothetical protein